MESLAPEWRSKWPAGEQRLLNNPSLILMESTWGINSDSEDPQWIRSFYRKVYKDNSFADLFRIMEERDRSRNEVYDLSSECLEDWFNQFAYYNYVAEPVGETSANTVLEATKVLGGQEVT
jgi:hypothetical protein